jgi:hypothetical protein
MQPKKGVMHGPNQCIRSKPPHTKKTLPKTSPESLLPNPPTIPPSLGGNLEFVCAGGGGVG